MGKASISTVGGFGILMSLFAAAHAQTPNFLAQEGPEMWSASKLRGVAIFGPGDKKVGTISEILLDHSGAATTIVIGVGGFLGIGEKEVAVPFDQVKFTDQPLPGQVRPPVAPGGANANDGAAIPVSTPADATSSGQVAPGLAAPSNNAPNAPVAPGMGTAEAPAAGAPSTLGSPVASTTGNSVPGANEMAAVPTGPVGAMEPSTAYPDHGLIDLTADQLKAAPAFKFAR